MVHTGEALEPEVVHVLAISDRADHRYELAFRDVRLSAHRFDALDDGVDLVGRRTLFHHDHHLAAFLNPRDGGSQGAGRWWRPALGCRSVARASARPDA